MVGLTAVLSLTSAAAFAAPPFLCRPIRPGETVEHVALWLTGRSDGVYDPRFQIVDAATSRIVPKAHYHVVRPGWLACVETKATTDAGAGVRQSNAAAVVRAACGAALAFLVILIGSTVMQRYSRATRRTIDQMNRFGGKFLREFERPLVQDRCSEPPLRFRVRCLPHRNRMEIFIAPRRGHHYPNLCDHRKNVEYDVDRITHALGDESFVSCEPYADGSWVVFPFERQSSPKTKGAT